MVLALSRSRDSFLKKFCPLLYSSLASDPNINSFMCRRGRAAKVLSKKAGLWSVEWKKRAEKWLSHLKRHPESPGGKVLAYHNIHWLRKTRAELLKKRNPKSLKYSLLSGWTDSRVRQGRPSARFEEAIEASRTR